jgi:hypothetical protein
MGTRHQVIPRSEVERYLGQDLRFVDLTGLGFVQKQKQPNTYKPKVRFVK